MRILKYAGILLVALVVGGAAVLKIMQSTVGGGHYSMPSGSMMPTLRPGETFIALPIGNPDALSRGDIVVFRKPTQPDVKYVFRIMGLPGDTIELRGGMVVLNGSPLPQESTEPFALDKSQHPHLRNCRTGPEDDLCEIDRSRETLPTGRAYGVLNLGETRLDTFGPTTVPPGHVFVMGDNRDNALDSRFPDTGMVPFENVSGVLWRRLFGQNESGFSLERSFGRVQ